MYVKMQVEVQMEYQLTDHREAIYKLLLTAIQLDGFQPAKCKDRNQIHTRYICSRKLAFINDYKHINLTLASAFHGFESSFAFTISSQLAAFVF
jgi:hypothetical protein